MFKWLYYNAPTVQAICSILGIVGLGWYARDTSQIRRETLAQADASRRPFPRFRFLEGNIPTNELENIGQGIAINLAWNFIREPERSEMRLSACPPKEWRTLMFGDQEVSLEKLAERGGIRTTYEDAAGKGYWSVLTVRRRDTFFLMTIETGQLHSRRKK